MQHDTTPPRLAAPGAGLPAIERFVANLMIRRKAAHTTREQAAAAFATERTAILNLLRGREEAALSQPVLIKRLPGLEDSSRYWSLLMVVDHLRIVNRDITEVITTLARGQVPEREVSTADVKPSPQVTPAVIAAFDQGCDDFQSAVAAVPDLRTAQKFPHPWFGPMDAATWHFMTGFHMELHRRQMKLILAGLPEAGAKGAGE
jgi:hypothetical protein